MPLLEPTPRLGGLLGQQAQPQAQPQQQKRSFLDRILGLYGADPATHIPQEQKQNALSEGLWNAGTTILAANKPGHDGATSAQMLGMGLQAMRGTGAMMGAQQKQLQLQQKLRGLIGGGASPAQMQAVMMELIAAGGEENLKAAGQISEVLKSLRGAQNKPVNVAPGNDLYDPAAGRVVHTNTNPAGSNAGAKPTTVYDEQGNPYLATWNPQTRSFDPIEGGANAKPPTTPRPTELMYRAQMFVPMADTAMDVIEGFEAKGGNVTRLNQLAEGFKINEVQDPQIRQLYTAGRQLGDAYLRMTSGAAIKEEEVDMFIRTFLPYPGDDKANLKLKQTMREQFVQGLKYIAGNPALAESVGAQIREGGGVDEDDLQDVVDIGAGEAPDSLSGGGVAPDSINPETGRPWKYPDLQSDSLGYGLDEWDWDE